MATPNLYNNKTTAPGTGNDNTLGYIPGDIWIDISHVQTYICMSNDTSNANWQAIPPFGSSAFGGSLIVTPATPGVNPTIKLVNDAQTPGNNQVYSTNSSGVKGWHTFTLTTIAVGVGISGGGSTSSLLTYNQSDATMRYIANVVGGVGGTVIFGVTGQNGFASLSDGGSNCAGYFYNDAGTYTAKLVKPSDPFAAQFANPTQSFTICNATEAGLITDGVNTVKLADGNRGISITDASGTQIYICSASDQYGLIVGTTGSYAAGCFTNDFNVAYVGHPNFAGAFFDTTINSVIICNNIAAISILGPIYWPTAMYQNEGVALAGLDSNGFMQLDPNCQAIDADVTTTSNTTIFAMCSQPNSAWVYDFTLLYTSPAAGFNCQLIGSGQTALTFDIATDTTPIFVTDVTQLAAGDIILIDNELILVSFVYPLSNSFDAIRGVSSTTAATHSAGTMIGTTIVDFYVNGTTFFDHKTNFGTAMATITVGTGSINLKAYVSFRNIYGPVALVITSVTGGQTTTIKRGSYATGRMCR